MCSVAEKSSFNSAFWEESIDVWYDKVNFHAKMITKLFDVQNGNETKLYDINELIENSYKSYSTWFLRDKNCVTIIAIWFA